MLSRWNLLHRIRASLPEQLSCDSGCRAPRAFVMHPTTKPLEVRFMAENLRERGRKWRAMDEHSSKARRWGALIIGGSIAAYGLSRRSPSGIALAAAGGLLAYSGARPNRERELIARSSMIINS